mmetsp:Transcript_42447/g.68266  ORF Transcript_42447/g.68266 Transcript_42447/m.68266 type:complete len:131 (-) Transcript_42447:80-472(-)
MGGVSPWLAMALSLLPPTIQHGISKKWSYCFDQLWDTADSECKLRGLLSAPVYRYIEDNCKIRLPGWQRSSRIKAGKRKQFSFEHEQKQNKNREPQSRKYTRRKQAINLNTTAKQTKVLENQVRAQDVYS